MHNEIKKIFVEESKSFFSERLKWKSDAMQEIETQNQRINKFESVTKDLAKRLHDYTGGFMNMTDSVLMMFLIVRNISTSMKSLNVMAATREQSM